MGTAARNQFSCAPRLGILALALALAAPGRAMGNASIPYSDRGTGERVALATGAVASSVFYTPVKAIYAAGGTVAGGLVFLMSAGQSSTAAGRIIDRSTGGDWYIHPDHLTGNRSLHFKGETVGPPPTSW